jgi:hypothetical protein
MDTFRLRSWTGEFGDSHSGLRFVNLFLKTHLKDIFEQGLQTLVITCWLGYVVGLVDGGQQRLVKFFVEVHLFSVTIQGRSLKLNIVIWHDSNYWDRFYNSWLYFVIVMPSIHLEFWLSFQYLSVLKVQKKTWLRGIAASSCLHIIWITLHGCSIDLIPGVYVMFSF